MVVVCRSKTYRYTPISFYNLLNPFMMFNVLYLYRETIGRSYFTRRVCCNLVKDSNQTLVVFAPVKYTPKNNYLSIDNGGLALISLCLTFLLIDS